MQNQKLFSAFQFQIYPLQFFILLVGFLIGLAIGRIINKDSNKIQQEKVHQEPVRVTSTSSQNIIENQIIAHSLNSGHSFQKQGMRHKLFKGHLYKYFQTLPLNKQQASHSFQISNSGLIKISEDGEWKKFYDCKIKIPKEGKYYYQIYIVKNQYFVKRQTSEKQSSVAVSRTDLVIGFMMVKENQNISQKVSQLCLQSQKQKNNIKNIIAYGLNGRIYDNGQLRTQQKVIKKNKVFIVYVNRDDGYIAYEVDGETIGFIIIPKQQNGVANQLIPFVEMYAVGSAVIVSS